MTEERKIYEAGWYYSDRDDKMHRYKQEAERGTTKEFRSTDFFNRKERRMSVKIPQTGLIVDVTQSNEKEYQRDLRKGRVGFSDQYLRAERLGSFLTRRFIDRVFPVDRW